MTNIPWREGASLIRSMRDSETQEAMREVVREGSLRTIVEMLAMFSLGEREKFIITLPDRGARPFRYLPSDFAMLIEQLGRVKFEEYGRGIGASSRGTS